MGVPVALTVVINKAATATAAGNTVPTDPNGKVEVTGTIIGAGQTAQALATLATTAVEAQAVPKVIPGAGVVLGTAGVVNNIDNINKAQKDGRPVAQADVAGVIANTAGALASGVALGVIIVGSVWCNGLNWF